MTARHAIVGMAALGMAGVLLFERTAFSDPKRAKPSDNTYCLDCHINYAKEKLATVHAKAGIGCVTCHGASDEHAADEEHLTAPDIIFARAKVNNSCMAAGCHARAQVESKKQHPPMLAGTDPKPRTCTDCHGSHTLPKRTRRWDKESRKLTEVDGRPPAAP